MEKVNLTAPQWQLALWFEYSPVGGGNGGPGIAVVGMGLHLGRSSGSLLPIFLAEGKRN